MLATPHGFKGKQNWAQFLSQSLYCGGFKGRREMSRYQVVTFAISANFGFNLSAKVYAGVNPYKNGDFLVGF